MVNFSFSSKPAVFHSLSTVDSETLPISKLELLIAIRALNSFQPLTIITKCSILDVAAVLDPPLEIANNFEPLNIVVKISVEFLNPHMTTKDDY